MRSGSWLGGAFGTSPAARSERWVGSAHRLDDLGSLGSRAEQPRVRLVRDRLRNLPSRPGQSLFLYSSFLAVLPCEHAQNVSSLPLALETPHRAEAVDRH